MSRNTRRTKDPTLAGMGKLFPNIDFVGQKVTEQFARRCVGIFGAFIAECIDTNDNVRVDWIGRASKKAKMSEMDMAEVMAWLDRHGFLSISEDGETILRGTVEDARRRKIRALVRKHDEAVNAIVNAHKEDSAEEVFEVGRKISKVDEELKKTIDALDAE